VAADEFTARQGFHLHAVDERTVELPVKIFQGLDVAEPSLPNPPFNRPLAPTTSLLADHSAEELQM
jgi:hypothetical protein